MGGVSMISPFLHACSADDLPLITEATMEPNRSEPTGSTATPSHNQATVSTDAPTQIDEDASIGDSARVAFVKTGDRAEGVHMAID